MSPDTKDSAITGRRRLPENPSKEVFMKRSLIAAAVLAALLCFSHVAQANLSTDHDYMVALQQGNAWHDAAPGVAGWGYFSRLALFGSHVEQRYVQNFFDGLRDEFWVGAPQYHPNQPRWVTEDPWGDKHPAAWEPPDNYSGTGLKGHPAAWSEHGSNYDRYDWRWNDEKWSPWRWSYKAAPIYISVIIVESSDPQVPTTATPVPPSVWLLGSGLAVMGVARVSWRNTRN